MGCNKADSFSSIGDVPRCNVALALPVFSVSVAPETTQNEERSQLWLLKLRRCRIPLVLVLSSALKSQISAEQGSTPSVLLTSGFVRMAGRKCHGVGSGCTQEEQRTSPVC